jgi:hypothetical protein
MAIDVEVQPPVIPVDQGPGDLCWLAATSVLFTWKGPDAYSMSDAAQRLGVEFQAKYAARQALSYDDLPLWQQRGGFESQAQQCIDSAGWGALLTSHGPLITLISADGGGQINHAIVVSGIKGDGKSDSTVLMFADGNGGVSRSLSMTDFVTVFELPSGTNQLFSVMYFP